MDTTKTTQDKLRRIETLIWSKLQYYINTNALAHSKSKSAWFIRPVTKSSKVQEEMKKFCDNLPSSIGFYITHVGEYIFAPIETKQDVYDFNEVKASITGQMILEKQKEILELKKVWLQDLKDLNESKKDLQLEGSL